MWACLQRVRTKRQPDWEHCLVKAMTTNETNFFRDLHPFDALRTTLIPEVTTRNAATRTLNIWSAACSSGQELYSIAMLLHEHFPQLLSWKLELVGTDLSSDILERARSGRFSQIEVNRGLPVSLLMKYFRRDGTHWRISPELSKAIKFTKMNLIEPWPALPTFDVEFLRNVLVYFAPETKKQILGKLRKVMRPGAVLVLGAAETTVGLNAAFQREQSGNSVFYRLT